MYFNTSVRIKIEPSRSLFYVNSNGTWTVTGIEYNKLFKGSTRVYADSLKASVTYDNCANNSNESCTATSDLAIITRMSYYKNNKTVIKDVYYFNGSDTSIENFPVEHQVWIYNGSGLIYQYEVRKLAYNGNDIVSIQSPQMFGNNMKVTWQDGYYYSKLYSTGKLIVKYRITSDTQMFSVKLFDPPTVNLNLNSISSHNDYELGSTVQANGSGGVGTTICFDIDHPKYNNTVNCAATPSLVNVSFSEVYVLTFNDSTRQKNLTTGQLFSLLHTNGTEIRNLSVRINGSQSPINNLTIDIGNDRTLEYRLPGKLYVNTLVIDEFTNGRNNETLSFQSSNQRISRTLDMPTAVYGYYIYLNVTGLAALSNLTLNFTDDTYKDNTSTFHNWSNSNLSLSMNKDIRNWSMDNTGSDSSEYWLFDTEEATPSAAPTVSSYYEANDGNLSSSSQILIRDINSGTQTVNAIVSAKGVTNQSLLTFKYTVFCSDSLDAGNTEFGGPVISAYNWATSAWDIIDSISCQCSCTQSDTQTLTWNLSSTESSYKNISNDIAFRITWSGGQVDSSNVYGIASIFEMSNANYGAYDNRTRYNTDTLSLFDSNYNITNITVNMSLNNFTQGKTDIFISVNNGNTFEQVPYENQLHQMNFTSSGRNVKARFRLYTNDMSITPVVYLLSLNNLLGTFPNNISFDIGNDGTIEHRTDGNLTTTIEINLTGNLSDTLSNYTTINCNSTKTVPGCMIPITFSSTSNGRVVINNINITSIPTFGPTDTFINLNITSIIRLCNISNCQIRFNVSFKAGNAVSLYLPRLGYYGDGNISITAFQSNNRTNNETFLAKQFYSNYNYTFPRLITALEFVPKLPTEKNVSAYGQTNTTSIFNVTTRNYGSRRMNFSVYLNDTHPCINLTIGPNSTKSQGTRMLNRTFYTFHSNQTVGQNLRIWLYADYSCNLTSWSSYNFELSFRGCCYNCTCDITVI